MRKLRTFVAALLLVPMLASNASAFTSDTEGAFDTARPKNNWCYFYWNGQWHYFPC